MDSMIRWEYMDSTGHERTTPWFPPDAEIRWTEKHRFQVWHSVDHEVYGFANVRRMLRRRSKSLVGNAADEWTKDE